MGDDFHKILSPSAREEKKMFSGCGANSFSFSSLSRVTQSDLFSLLSIRRISSANGTEKTFSWDWYRKVFIAAREMFSVLGAATASQSIGRETTASDIWSAWSWSVVYRNFCSARIKKFTEASKFCFMSKTFILKTSTWRAILLSSNRGLSKHTCMNRRLQLLKWEWNIKVTQQVASIQGILALILKLKNFVERFKTKIFRLSFLEALNSAHDQRQKKPFWLFLEHLSSPTQPLSTPPCVYMKVNNFVFRHFSNRSLTK